MKQNATIIDIAKRAGVSSATVSRVINGTGRVQDKTRERVEEAIREMHYQPNLMAKNLSTVHSDVIGMLVSDVRNPFYANIFVECEKYANEKGYSLHMCNYQNSEEMEFRYYNLLMAQRACAIIHIGGSIDRKNINTSFRARLQEISEKIPVVTSVPVEGTGCRCVKLDNRRSMQALMEHLMELGHEKIALAGGLPEMRSTFERRECYHEILRQRGLKYQLIVGSGTYDIQGGYLAAREILRGDELPTAVIAMNDFLAIGVVQAIQEQGLRIGRDISVASFDNTYLSEISQPEITSVGNDYYVFSRAVIDMVMDLLQKKPVEDILDLPIQLAPRESCQRRNTEK